jgi:zinc protease
MILVVITVLTSGVSMPAGDMVLMPELHSKRLLNDLQITVATPPGHDEQGDQGDALAIGLVMRYGSTFDPEGKGGLAYFLSRMFMMRAAEKNLRDIEQELAYLGADIEVHCGWDGIHFLLQGKNVSYERALLLLYQIVAEARFEEDDFVAVRQAIMDELRKSTDPREYIRGRFEDVLFAGTTYSRPLRGTVASVSSITLGDIRYFYRRLFSPHQASLQIVGDVPVEQALQRATRIWGVWVRQDDVPFSFLRPQNPAGRQVFLEDIPESPATQFVMGGLFPRREDPRFLSAVFAGRILQERLTALMPTSLITVGLEGRRLASPFFIQGQAAADQAVAEIQQIQKAVEEMKRTPVSEDELASIRQQLIDEFNDALQSNVGIGTILLDAELYRLGSNYPAIFLNRVQLVDSEAVRQAVNEWIFSDGELIVLRGPFSIMQSTIGELGPVRRLSSR